MSLDSGSQLGPYRIVGALGAGGMGEVYRATDTRLDRTVAIKVLPGDVANDPVQRERFEREARAIAALNHRNICTLHDIGHAQPSRPPGAGANDTATTRENRSVDFLVMEFLEGETLGQRLERGMLPFDEAVRIASEIAEALDVAHHQGIIHRDLKPGNVMLSASGVKLLDFGLARLREPEGQEGIPGCADPRRADNGGHHSRHVAVHVARAARWEDRRRPVRHLRIRRHAVRDVYRSATFRRKESSEHHRIDP